MGAWIGVVPPRATQSFLFLENHEIMNARALELDGHAQARHASADDQHLADRWCDLPTARFNDEYLRAKGLDWAAQVLAAGRAESERKSA